MANTQTALVLLQGKRAVGVLRGVPVPEEPSNQEVARVTADIT